MCDTFFKFVHLIIYELSTCRPVYRLTIYFITLTPREENDFP